MFENTIRTGLLIIYIIGIVQGLYLTAFLLIYQRNRRPGNLILAALVFTLTMSVLCQFLIISGLYKSLLFIFLVLSGVPFLAGPLLYWYVSRIAAGKSAGQIKAPLHFLPFFANMIFLFF